MNDDIQSLNELFLKIKNQGWIKTKRKGSTGIGYTFECLINKKEDNQPKPDFNSIEIKTIRNYSNKKVHLFSINPDGDCAHPIENILKILGYTSRINNCRSCCIDVYANKMTQLEYYKRIKLNCNYEKNKIELIAINNYNDYLEVNTSWSFNKIEERINNKIKYLAVINADSKIINQEEYFFYKSIRFYEIKGFDTFMKLIENGIIKGTIKVSEKNSKTFSHGIVFSIEEKNLNSLYQTIQQGVAN